MRVLSRTSKKACFATFALTHILLSACSDSSKSAPTAAHGFAIIADKSGIAVTTDTTLTRLKEFSENDRARYGTSAVWLDSNTAVVLSGTVLAQVTADGVSTVAHCDECRGLALYGEHIYTTRANYRPGDGFDIVTFDRRLNETGSIPASRLIERAGRVQNDESSSLARMIGATPESIYIAYVSRHGGARHGPSVLAQYSHTGELQNHLLIDGLVRDAATSPDMKYVALTSSGSSGACVNPSDVRVVDLATLTELHTDPDIPAESGVTHGGWFEARTLTWSGNRLTSVGELHDPPGEDVCDPQPQIWSRTYDPAGQAFTDEIAQETVGLQVVGPSCDRKIGYAPSFPWGKVVYSSPDGLRTIATEATILGVTVGGLKC